MPYRDEQGHFISEAEARDRGLIPEPEPDRNPDDLGEGEMAGEPERPTFGQAQRQAEVVPVDTGRGNVVEVPAGSPFVPTLERLADEAHYGGYFRIFLNGREIINPEDSPETIESGMRLVVTSYDKVG